MYDPKRDLVWMWQNPDIYALRVTGGTGQIENPGPNTASFSLLIPNPMHPSARIMVICSQKFKRLQLFNVKGEKLMDCSPRVSPKTIRLPADLPTGVYWLRLTGQKEILIKKFVVLR
jgi:hypothetical protein